MLNFSDESDLTSMYLSSSACIGASGSSSWERACIGLPSAQFPIVDNQTQVHKTLVFLDAIFCLQDTSSAHKSFDFQKLADFFQKLEDNVWLNALSQRSSSAVDGLGCLRIVSFVQF